MDPIDPPPFGYTFDSSSHDRAPTNLNSQPILNQNEEDELEYFFATQGQFHDQPLLPSQRIATRNGEDYYSLGPPPSVHQVSTVPGGQLPPLGFQNGHTLAADVLSSSQHQNTQDGLRAGPTLFNTQMFSDFGPFGGANGNVMDMPTSNSELPYTAPTLDSDPRYNAQYPLTTTHDMSSLQQHSNGTPLVPTSHGVIPEPLAAVLPLHSDPNSADASLATFFSNRQSIAQEPCQQRRPGGPYEFGSDAAFNDSGYEAPIPDLEDAVEERLLHDASTAFPSLPIEPASGTDPDADFATPSKVSNGDLKRSSLKPSSQNEEHGVEQARKKRKPSTTIAKPSSNQRQMAFPGRLGEGASGRCPSKVRKQSTTDQTNSTKKRLSSAGAKALRENLTDEQKRNNHVNSEQKRRDLIKQCTLDLRNLVPALRRVTLSRSVELTEARIFLEQLLRDNEEYRALAEGPGG